MLCHIFSLIDCQNRRNFFFLSLLFDSVEFFQSGSSLQLNKQCNLCLERMFILALQTNKKTSLKALLERQKRKPTNKFKSDWQKKNNTSTLHSIPDEMSDFAIQYYSFHGQRRIWLKPGESVRRNLKVWPLKWKLLTPLMLVHSNGAPFCYW